MYIVISMPNRRSIAQGVSHFMALLLVAVMMRGDEYPAALGATVPD